MGGDDVEHGDVEDGDAEDGDLEVDGCCTAPAVVLGCTDSVDVVM